MALVAEPSLRIVLHHTKLNKYRKEGREGPMMERCGSVTPRKPRRPHSQMQRTAASFATTPPQSIFRCNVSRPLLPHHPSNTSPLMHKVNFGLSESWTNLQNVNCNIVPLFNIHSFSLVAEFHPYNMKSKFSDRLLLKQKGIFMQ